MASSRTSSKGTGSLSAAQTKSNPRRRAQMAQASVPATGRTRPSSESSPT